MMRQAIRKTLAVAAIGVAGLAATGAAQAGNVFWSVGINLPAVTVVGGNAPVYYPAPAVVYAPPPVVYAPAPVVYAPPPQVVYRPAPVIYQPAPVVVHQPYRQHAKHPQWKQGHRDWNGQQRWSKGRDRDDDRRQHRHGRRDG